MSILKRQSTSYKFALGLALAGPLLLLWVNLAVGIIGEPDDLANLIFAGVLAVGVFGAVVGRLQPLGMSRALFATALAQLLAAVIILLTGLGFPPSGPKWVLTFNGFFVVLWLASAWLFRRAATDRQADAAGV
jgi:hypothetical protein